MVFILAPNNLTMQDTESVLEGETVQMLLVGDPFAIAIQNSLPQLMMLAGGIIEIEIVSYNDVRQLILLNTRDSISNYDVVAFDVVWMGEFAQTDAFLPLNALIERDSETIMPDDFLRVAYEASAHEGVQYGLPIQPHPELLWYRTDLFAEAGIEPPLTTDALLTTAARLTRPENNQYGICWNAQRGQALGQQVSHFYAAFGQPLIDAEGNPTLNTERGLAVAEYLMALLDYSPPDILSMAWDQRVLRFAQGWCAMTYGWGARAFLVEDPDTSPVSDQVGYAAAPHAPNAESVTPLGTWSLAIPANIGARDALAWDFLSWLTSPQIQYLLAENGNGGMPRHTLLEDDALIAEYPIFPTVHDLDEAGELADWMRPAIPQWSELADILGTVYHDMLEGILTPQQAIDQAQLQAERLLNQ